MSNVCTPVPAVKVPLLVMPPRNETASLAELFQLPFAFTVTRPLKVLVPVVDEMVKVPLVPPPTVVVPVTETFLVEVSSVPEVTVRFPPTVVLPPRVTVPADLVTVTL